MMRRGTLSVRAVKESHRCPHSKNRPHNGRHPPGATLPSTLRLRTSASSEDLSSAEGCCRKGEEYGHTARSCAILACSLHPRETKYSHLPMCASPNISLVPKTTSRSTAPSTRKASTRPTSTPTVLPGEGIAFPSLLYCFWHDKRASNCI